MQSAVRAARVEKRRSQTDLAIKLGITVQAYSKKELGQRKFTVSEGHILTAELDKPFDELFPAEGAVGIFSIKVDGQQFRLSPWVG